jgi:glycerol-3-phosphate dehydrogenase (NAD(P)+)
LARLTVFGAGAMGTAVAMHSARAGVDTALWANPFDALVLEHIRAEGRHPGLPEHLPSTLAVHGPEELDLAAKDVEIAVLGATSDTVRSLIGMVREVVDDVPFVVSLAKGVETDTAMRISEVVGAELPRPAFVTVAGPCLASELAIGVPSSAVWASASIEDARAAGTPLVTPAYQLVFTDDLAGVEYCTASKNVAAIGIGILDGLGKLTGDSYRNAKAALYTMAIQELCVLVEAQGGRKETAMGLAGVGDVLVTGAGGRNRLYGELIGEGQDPADAREQLEGRGMTVEGAASAGDVRRMARAHGLHLPYHEVVYRIVFEGDDPHRILDALVSPGVADDER